MRVLTLASEFPPAHGYGLGRYVAAHTAALAAQGCEVAVACSNWDGGLPDGTYEADGVEVANSPIFMPVKGYTWVAEVLQANLLLEARAFEMAGRSGGFDLIQIHDWLAASAAWSVHELLGAPLVVTMHDTVRGRNQGQLSAEEQYMAEMEAWICERADLVLANSEFTRRELIEAYGVDADKLLVVGCGVDPAAFETDTDPRLFRSVLAPPDAPMISFVGRLTPAKGPQVLLEAVPHVLRLRPDAQFIFAGDGAMREGLQRRVHDLHIGSNVRFTGHLRGKVLATLYRASELVVVPSLYEPFGMVALEAIAAGRPLIASDTGGLREIMAGLEGAVPVPPNDPQALARAILQLLADPARARRLAESARTHALERFRWEDVARRTLRAYERLVA